MLQPTRQRGAANISRHSMRKLSVSQPPLRHLHESNPRSSKSWNFEDLGVEIVVGFGWQMFCQFPQVTKNFTAFLTASKEICHLDFALGAFSRNRHSLVVVVECVLTRKKTLVSVTFFARNTSGAGNGCANFMGVWKNAFFLHENLMPIKFLVLGGGGVFWVLRGGSADFIFMGARISWRKNDWVAQVTWFGPRALMVPAGCARSASAAAVGVAAEV